MKLEVIDIIQAKEILSLKPKKSYLIIGSYDNIQQLRGVVNENVFLLAHVCGSQTITNGPFSLANGSIKSMNGPQRLINGTSHSDNVMSKDPKSNSNGCSLYRPILSHHVKSGEKLVLLKKVSVKWQYIYIKFSFENSDFVLVYTNTNMYSRYYSYLLWIYIFYNVSCYRQGDNNLPIDMLFQKNLLIK